jgi:hypothetical protein
VRLLSLLASDFRADRANNRRRDYARSFFEQDRLTGDWGGARKQWQDAGIDLGINDTAETLSNLTGGVRQLTIYQGLLDLSLTLDLEKLAKWPGASFYIDGYQISGRGLSKNAIGNLLTVSSIAISHDTLPIGPGFPHTASGRLRLFQLDVIFASPRCPTARTYRGVVVSTTDVGRSMGTHVTWHLSHCKLWSISDLSADAVRRQW